MKQASIAFALLGVVTTIASLAVWAATDRHYYTKFRVVEEVERQVDTDDPFANTGLYEEGQTETVARDEFHLGLLPTPQGIFDKHAMSVLTFAAPPWVVAGALAFVARRQRRQAEATPDEADTSGD